MVTPWYIWLVGRWNAGPEGDDWAVVGVFTTLDKAKTVAYPGCFIAILPIDEELTAGDTMSVEWVE